jgi:hypothetical protein
MSLNWNEIDKALIPLKNYDDMKQRLHESFSYLFIRDKFDFSMDEIIHFTQSGIGMDPKGRYSHYSEMLVRTFIKMQEVGVCNILDLVGRIDTKDQLETFSKASGIDAINTVEVLKYLIYWFLPMKKPLNSLARNYADIDEAIKALRGIGIHSNLDLLQHGLTLHDREFLARGSGLPEVVVSELVHRADFSRMPWASKATISNIVGAGYGSMQRLAQADTDQLREDYFRYGKVIGKNLQLGNEIENSQRFARLIPPLVQDS